MEINITPLKEMEAPMLSASNFKMGTGAGKITWDNCMLEVKTHYLINTPSKRIALRDHIRGFGAWDDEEIDNWDANELNAFFLQMIAGDIREAGYDYLEDIDWIDYQEQVEDGTISGLMFKADDGDIYYHVGD